MTNTHSANFELTSRASYSKILTTTNVYPPSRPRRNTEIQLPQLPDNYFGSSLLLCAGSLLERPILGGLGGVWAGGNFTHASAMQYAAYYGRRYTILSWKIDIFWRFLAETGPWCYISLFFFFRVNQALSKQRHLLVGNIPKGRVLSLTFHPDTEAIGALRGHELLNSRWFPTLCFLSVVSGKR